MIAVVEGYEAGFFAKVFGDVDGFFAGGAADDGELEGLAAGEYEFCGIHK